MSKNYSRTNSIPNWLVLLFLVAIAACGKPTAANRDPEIPATKVAEEPAIRKNAGMVEADLIAALIDPAKLATLKERGANPRIHKITAILIKAKTAGKNPEEITHEAIQKIGWENTLKGSLTRAAILRNLDILEELGSTTDEDITEMKKGQSPTVRRGPHAGDVLSVDHIIPRAIVPELDNVIANLELMPLRSNQSKGDTIGQRQRDFARQLHAAGLLKSPYLPEK
jgi:hypothetical protein